MGLEKAYFAKRDKNNRSVKFVECMFNPKEMTITRSNQFGEENPKGYQSSVHQFGGGKSRTLTMDLFFDTYEKQEDVRIYTDKITGCDDEGRPEKGLMDIDSDQHTPPICIFTWGTFNFHCIIQSVTKKFTMFLPNGTPVRATLSVTLLESRDIDKQVKEMDTHSSDLTKSWVVSEGDSLWEIAAKEYGRPEDWRLIAKKNNIENPRFLTPGQRLIIPVKE
jgi:hypothetical protein